MTLRRAWEVIFDDLIISVLRMTLFKRALSVGTILYLNCLRETKNPALQCGNKVG